MIFSVALTTRLHQRLCGHLVRPDQQEDLCFALWYPSRGASRTVALLNSIVLPQAGERTVHGNAEFTTEYFLRASNLARRKGAGIALLHSHPAPGWQGMSPIDAETESRLAPTAATITGMPLVGLTLGAVDETWSARFWEHVGPRAYRPTWCENVRIVGGNLTVSFAANIKPIPQHRASQQRTISAWGPTIHANLTRLRVGVIGLGSVGSIVAEALVRTGVQELVLMDHDTLKEVNLDRTLHAYPEDVREERLKVELLGPRIAKSATAENFSSKLVPRSVCTEAGYRAALDCDVLFSCVDRPWPRSVLNFLAYAHLIPVIDGGIAVTLTNQARVFKGADWKAHVATYDHRCLHCLEQYNPADVSAEQEGHLDDPEYIARLPQEHRFRRNENVFCFSLGLASLEMAQFVMLVARPLNLRSQPQNYHLINGSIDIGKIKCNKTCDSPGIAGKGESAGHPGIID